MNLRRVFIITIFSFYGWTGERGFFMKSRDNNICIIFGYIGEDVRAFIWDEIYYIFFTICNYYDENKMWVLGKTLNLYNIFNVIFLKVFNENFEFFFVILILYIGIYVWNCYIKFLVKMFLINNVFKFFIVRFDGKFCRVVIIFFIELIWKL